MIGDFRFRPDLCNLLGIDRGNLTLCFRSYLFLALVAFY